MVAVSVVTGIERTSALFNDRASDGDHLGIELPLGGAELRRPNLFCGPQPKRTIAGLSSARARGRNGGRPYTMTLVKLRLAQAAMAKRDTKVSDLCTELGVTRQTLYRFVGPKGELRADATKLLHRKAQNVSS